MHKLPQRIYFDLFEKECLEELRLTRAKNTDYANTENAFQNFNGIEYFSAGSITTEQGIIVRMTDKFQRVINLINRPKNIEAVKDESIIDTLRDISVYAKILRIYIQTKVSNANEITNDKILNRADKNITERETDKDIVERAKANSANISTR